MTPAEIAAYVDTFPTVLLWHAEKTPHMGCANAFMKHAQKCMCMSQS